MMSDRAGELGTQTLSDLGRGVSKTFRATELPGRAAQVVEAGFRFAPSDASGLWVAVGDTVDLTTGRVEGGGRVCGSVEVG